MKYATILCGHKGLGKSTYSVRKWPSYLLIECDNLVLIKTYSLLEQTLYTINEQKYSSYEKLLTDFISVLINKQGVIIDNSEQIDEISLKLIVNLAKQYKKNIVFIFDISYQELYKSKPFSKLIEWDIINYNSFNNDFRAETSELRDFISKNFFNITNLDFEKVIKITNYNFNEIKKIIWISKTKGNGGNNILSDEIINDYLKNKLENDLLNISPELIDILKKSSVIGEIFEKYPLEHKNGFNILGISNYLEDIENLEIYIAKYLSKKDTFKFISNSIYNAVLSSISSFQKNEWHEILKKYYIQTFEYSNDENTKTEALINAKRSALQISDFQTVFELNQVLLFRYLNYNDIYKAISIIDEVLEDNFIKKNKNYQNYLLSIKMRILIDMGEYKNALGIVKEFLSDSHFRGSQDYLKYYHIKCLYNIGDVDTAYCEIIELINKIKNSSKGGINNQKIYPLVYSMMSSIQNHLNLDDDGVRYYVLALNHAYNLVNNKTLYYEILSKCDMFFSNDTGYSQLTKCADFFKKTGNNLKAAKVYLNLATEMMFNGHESEHEILEYFDFAKNAFKVPDEHLAYIKNNLAIYYILAKNDFRSAINELESALFVNLSEFTYMTIFLNLSMCYFKINGSENKEFIISYEQFQKYESLVESRKNRTKYEIMYRVICDLIISKHSKDDINNICDKYSTSSKCPEFFIPIFNDIKKRNSNNTTEEIYKNNNTFYKKINEKKIFLAELRFWE